MGLLYSKDADEITSRPAEYESLEQFHSEASRLFFLTDPLRRNNSDSRSRASSPIKSCHDEEYDDGGSKATESTKGSPDVALYGRSPTRGRRGDSQQAVATTRNSTPRKPWFRRPSLTQDGGAVASVALPPSVSFTKRDGSKASSVASIPVPRSLSRAGEEEEVEHWQKVYDSRTWDMYLRIVESRKNRPTTHMAQALASTGTDDTYLAVTPPMDDSINESHEMIFGSME